MSVCAFGLIVLVSFRGTSSIGIQLNMKEHRELIVPPSFPRNDEPRRPHIVPEGEAVFGRSDDTAPRPLGGRVVRLATHIRGGGFQPPSATLTT